MIFKRINLLSLILIFFSIIFFGCKKEDQTRLQASWSANDPILIPFNIRNNEKNLGNLVQNPSFETGKVYYEKGNLKSYDITGWKKVGNNIKWVISENGDFSEDEVYKGTHAIKIERNIADETESVGEGIISDFIKVIPGNYSLKFFLKLENVCPNQARIGTKMYDAINIRLQFFDKNKIEINGDELDAFRNKKIDNTFKSLTLSNFWQIEKFGWGEVHGKTAHFPFYDGDVPDEARYVKIYIGLKGTGKMWIDNVDFRYTDKNFTMLERMKPYFDSSYFVYDLVFPQPKQLIKKSQLELFNKEQNAYPIILIPDNATINIKEAAQAFREMLISVIKTTNNSISPEIRIVNNVNEIKDKQLVISLSTSNLYKKYEANLPDTILTKHKSAYYIIQPENEKNIILINGFDEAIKYAIQTFRQLIDKKALYNSANIIDYPDITERAILMHYFDGELNELYSKLNLFGEYKFSDIYFEWYNNDNKKHFPFNSPNDLLTENNSMNYNLMIDLVKLNAQQSLKSNESLNYKSLLSKSYKSLLFAGDYYQPYEDCNQDKVVFYSNNNLTKNVQSDHIKFLKDFSKHVANQNSRTKLEFLSSWNRLDLIDKGQGRAEIYYYDLSRNISDNITMYWTGGTYYSESIDYAEHFRINEIIGHSPALFDNSLLAKDQRLNTDYLKSYYAGKIRTMSFFEPYNLQTVSYQANAKTILNTNQLSELNTIRILTASNYFWNTASYNPDKSLWIVLNKLYGRENAIKLLKFNDSYYGLKEICQKIESDGSQFKNIRIARNFETELIKYAQELENSIDDKVLLSEINKLKTEILTKYNNLVSADK
ncbi:MAG TPA: hypothetical protein DCG75_01400 [Bacteroidales bacterium]|nr:hypothetical protein [Bacteroidales bacterium]